MYRIVTKVYYICDNSTIDASRKTSTLDMVFSRVEEYITHDESPVKTIDE